MLPHSTKDEFSYYLSVAISLICAFYVLINDKCLKDERTWISLHDNDLVLFDSLLPSSGSLLFLLNIYATDVL